MSHLWRCRGDHDRKHIVLGRKLYLGPVKHSRLKTDHNFAFSLHERWRDDDLRTYRFDDFFNCGHDFHGVRGSSRDIGASQSIWRNRNNIRSYGHGRGGDYNGRLFFYRLALRLCDDSFGLRGDGNRPFCNNDLRLFCDNGFRLGGCNNRLIGGYNLFRFNRGFWFGDNHGLRFALNDFRHHIFSNLRLFRNTRRLNYRSHFDDWPFSNRPFDRNNLWLDCRNNFRLRLNNLLLGGSVRLRLGYYDNIWLVCNGNRPFCNNDLRLFCDDSFRLGGCNNRLIGGYNLYRFNRRLWFGDNHGLRFALNDFRRNVFSNLRLFRNMRRLDYLRPFDDWSFSNRPFDRNNLWIRLNNLLLGGSVRLRLGYYDNFRLVCNGNRPFCNNDLWLFCDNGFRLGGCNNRFVGGYNLFRFNRGLWFDDNHGLRFALNDFRHHIFSNLRLFRN